MRQDENHINGLRDEEERVGQILMKHFGDQQSVYCEKGEDPPDLYLYLDEKRFAVEVSRLRLLTRDKDGNRESDIAYGERIRKDLASEFGHLVPESMAVFLKLDLPIPKEVRKPFKKKLMQFFYDLAPKLEKGAEYCTEIFGMKVLVKGLNEGYPGVKVNLFPHQTNALVNLNDLAYLMLLNAISEKNVKCKSVSHPKWLALINTDPLIDPRLYNSVYAEIVGLKGFDRIFVINDGMVSELGV